MQPFGLPAADSVCHKPSLLTVLCWWHLGIHTFAMALKYRQETAGKVRGGIEGVFGMQAQLLQALWPRSAPTFGRVSHPPQTASSKFVRRPSCHLCVGLMQFRFRSVWALFSAVFALIFMEAPQCTSSVATATLSSLAVYGLRGSLVLKTRVSPLCSATLSDVCACVRSAERDLPHRAVHLMPGVADASWFQCPTLPTFSVWFDTLIVIAGTCARWRAHRCMCGPACGLCSKPSPCIPSSTLAYSACQRPGRMSA